MSGLAVGASAALAAAVLLAHAPDDAGRCPRCRTWLGARRWPCGVWRTAQQRLIEYDLAAGDPAASEPVPARTPLHAGTSASTSATSAPGAVPLGVTISARHSEPEPEPRTGDS